MDEQDRMLAKAWRDLAGLHVGMVLASGTVISRRALDRMADGLQIPLSLPALDSPANWGHWLAWMVVHTSTPVDVHTFTLGGAIQWRVTYRGHPRSTHGGGRPARALLMAYVRGCLLSGSPNPWPKAPSVLAWWKEVAE